MNLGSFFGSASPTTTTRSRPRDITCPLSDLVQARPIPVLILTQYWQRGSLRVTYSYRGAVPLVNKLRFVSMVWSFTLVREDPLR